MKISSVQLQMAISRLKGNINGWGSKANEDVTIDVQLTTADPGSGQMVDAMTLSATALVEGDAEEKVVSMTVELYDSIEKQEPRATKTEVFKVKKSY